MPTSPGPLLESLDALWARLQEDVPVLLPVRFAVTHTPPSPNHGPERWRMEGDLLSGIVISADTLDEGEAAVLEHVLHEAAHILCWLRGQQDTTTRGTYHNQTFLSTAEEMGLEWPEGAQRMAGRGYANPRLTDAAAGEYAENLKALAKAIPLTLPHLIVPETPKSTKPERLTLQCKCDKPRNIRVSQTVAALGPITCGVCGKAFSETGSTSTRGSK